MILRKVVGLLAGAVLLTGCGETSAGVAVRIGDQTIETSDFAGRVARAYENAQFAEQTPAREEYQRQVLNDLVFSRLVRVAAERLGVEVTDEQLDRRMDEVVQSYGGREAFERLLPTRGFHVEDVDDVLRTELLRDAVLDKLVEDLPTTDEQLRAEYQRQLPQLDRARISHILLHDRALAERVARRARSGADFAVLARQFTQDPDTKGQGGDLGPLGNGEGKFSKAFEEAVFAAKVGAVVGPIKARVEGAPKDTGYHVVKVFERQTRSFGEVRDDLRRSILRDQRTQRFNRYLADLANELGVKVNPRFGRWDQQQLVVVATDGNSLSSPAPVPGADNSGVVPPAGVPPQQGQPGQPGQGQPGGGQGGQPGGGQPSAPAGS